MLNLLTLSQECSITSGPETRTFETRTLLIWEQSRGLVHQISQSTKNSRTLAPKYEHQLFRKNSYNIKNDQIKRSCKQVIRI